MELAAGAAMVVAARSATKASFGFMFMIIGKV
jgi:hypothetical protein